MTIEYLEINEASLELIKPLWEELRDHHASLSKYFSQDMSKKCFEERSRDLLNKSRQGQVKIVFARDEATKEPVGYCISSINDAHQGEIDSIFILPDFRGKGVGSTLMERTLDWFKSQGVEDVCISVLFGNEQALKFYEKYGFYPKSYMLKNI